MRNTKSDKSLAMQVMDEAIEMAIEERSPYPERAAFIDADTARTGSAIKRAFREDRAVVLVSAGGGTRTLLAEPTRG